MAFQSGRYTQITVRLPDDLADFMGELTKRNSSSWNKEIAACIRERMDRETQPQT